jgi:hypothetical protein
VVPYELILYEHNVAHLLAPSRNIGYIM